MIASLPSLGVGLGFRERSQERGGASEQDRVAGLDGGAAERARQMCFADSARADEK